MNTTNTMNTTNKTGWSDYPGLATLARLRGPISDYGSATAKRQLHRNGLALAAAEAQRGQRGQRHDITEEVQWP